MMAIIVGALDEVSHTRVGSGRIQAWWFAVRVRSLSRNACVRTSLCPYRPLIFCSTYSLTFRRATGGMFRDERMRLMTLAEGPALLSELSNAQAVLRHTPRTAACLAVVSHPAAINASRISASFEACLAFASNWRSAPGVALLCLILLSAVNTVCTSQKGLQSRDLLLASQ
jgi:hypothetical protein